jgi:hypothetical protein
MMVFSGHVARVGVMWNALRTYLQNFKKRSLENPGRKLKNNIINGFQENEYVLIWLILPKLFPVVLSYDYVIEMCFRKVKNLLIRYSMISYLRWDSTPWSQNVKYTWSKWDTFIFSSSDFPSLSTGGLNYCSEQRMIPFASRRWMIYH